MSPASLVGLLALVRLVLAAPPDAPPDAALSWRAWAAGSGEMAEPALPREHVGALQPRLLSAELPATDARWLVLVHGEAGGDAWLAAAFAGSAPSVPLVRLPTPEIEPEPQEGRVRLRWEPPGIIQGLAGWHVLRNGPAGAEVVGAVGRGATTFLDERPGHEATWSLRPVFVDGLTGPPGRASEPLPPPAPPAR